MERIKTIGDIHDFVNRLDYEFLEWPKNARVRIQLNEEEFKSIVHSTFYEFSEVDMNIGYHKVTLVNIGSYEENNL